MSCVCVCVSVCECVSVSVCKRLDIVIPNFTLEGHFSH